MQLPSPIYLLLLVTLATCSGSSIFSKSQEQLLRNSQHSYQHSQEVDSRISGHLEQQFHDLPQKKVKYSNSERDPVKETKMRVRRDTLQKSVTSFASRTFGLRRPLKMALPSIMFKLGIATTMLVVLVLLVTKSLLVGLAILVIQLSSVFAKFGIWKKGHEHKEEEIYKPPQNIHVHVHGQQGYYKSSYSHSPYSTYSSHSPYSDWSKKGALGINNRYYDDDFNQRLLELRSELYHPEALTERIDNDYYQRLRELKELNRLRESLYTQVV